MSASAAEGEEPVAPSVMGEPSASGRFGEFGGRFVPESLMPACLELEDGLPRRLGRPGLPRRVRRHPARLRRAAHAGHRVPPAVGAPRRAGPAQARGPRPHRLAQAQQRDRPGAAGPADGQAAAHRRDRRRPARRGRRPPPRRCSAWTASCTWARSTPQRQELNVFRMELLGAEVRPVRGREPHPQGRRERGAAGLGGERGRHPLLPRVGDGARIPTRGWCASSSGWWATRPASSAGPCSTEPTPTGWWPASAAGRTRRGPSPDSSTPTPSLVGVEAAGGAAVGPGRARRGARDEVLRPPGRGRPDRRGLLDLGRARLSRASAPSTPTCRRSGGPATSRPATTRSLAAFRLLSETEGIIPALGARPRPGLAGARGGADRARRAPPCSSRCRGGATRTWPRSASMLR